MSPATKLLSIADRRLPYEAGGAIAIAYPYDYRSEIEQIIARLRPENMPGLMATAKKRAASLIGVERRATIEAAAFRSWQRDLSLTNRIGWISTVGVVNARR